MQRTQITETQIDKAMEELKTKLKLRLEEKGYGTFASTHEIAGVIDEEYRELQEAVHYNNREDFKDELLDIAVGAVFGVACVNAETLDF